MKKVLEFIQNENPANIPEIILLMKDAQSSQRLPIRFGMIPILTCPSNICPRLLYVHKAGAFYGSLLTAGLTESPRLYSLSQNGQLP